MTPSPDLTVKPALAGELVILRAFGAQDLPAMRAVMLDPEGRILTGSVHDEAQARPADGGTGGACPRLAAQPQCPG